MSAAQSAVAVLLLGALSCGSARAQAPFGRAAEAGLPFLTSFGPIDYGAGEENWAVTQDTRGVIYAGNSDGVLEYDGATWRLITLPNRSTVRSLATDSRGRIWVGGVGDLGYLAPDPRGHMTFVSLRDRIPARHRAFDDVWKVHVTDDGVYFTSYEALFRWDGRQMRVWRPESQFHVSFLVDGVVYVREWGRGLLRVERYTETGQANPALRVVPDGRRFGQTRIYAILPFGAGRMLVGTREEGLFLYDGTSFEPFATEVDPILAESGLYTGARLPGDVFALGTRWQGLLLIDSRGRLIQRLDRDSGLPDNTVLDAHDDGAGNLWLGLSSGIARVELGAPATRFGVERGVTSSPMAFARHQGRLYAANTHGGPTYLDAQAGTFRSISGAPSHSPDLLSVGGDLLLAGSNDGLHRIRGDRSEAVRPADAYDFRTFELHAWSRDPRIVLAGLNGGMALLHRGDAAAGGTNWTVIGRIPGVEGDVQEIVEASDGALWLGDESGHAIRVRLPESGPGGNRDLRRAVVTRYGPRHGLPSGLLVPYRVAGRIYFSAGGERLFHFDEASGRFAEDHTFDEAKSGHLLSRLALREDADGRVWVSSTYGPPVVAQPRSDGRGYRFDTLHRLRRNRIRDVYAEPDGIVWLMGAGEVIRFDTRRQAVRTAGLPPLVRQVSTPEDLLYDGAGDASESEVQHGAGALRFAFAAPGGAGATRYRTRLDGFDEAWSVWSDDTERSYTNLPPGRYRFLVEAEGRPAGSPFVLGVLPPWYRTWWSYVLFGLVGVFTLRGAYRYRTSQLFRRQLALEHQVAERTQALRAEKQKTEAQSERLREMDRLKSRFFTNVSHEFRTPLTLTIGPLEDLQADGDSLPNAAQRTIAVALRNSRRLLRLINQLLDVAKLEAGEMHLDARLQDLTVFVQGIARSFAPLAERRRVRLSVKAVDYPIPVPFDADKLEQVIVNLLSNAFKFTPEGGDISVSVSREGQPGESAALVVIRDNGPGIDPDALPHLFERFYQANETHSDVQPGTGVGLSLAKDLAELHGGTITVESEVGFGATFTVRLPLIDEPLPADGAGAPETGLPVRARGPQGPPAHDFDVEDPLDLSLAEETGGGDDRTTVLIADDNAEIRAYVRHHLEPHYRIIEAPDGAAALAKARASLPDLIVSDVMMPGLDGIALVRALRADPQTDFIPIILLTARATEDDRVEGLVEGSDAYITKPFNVRELQAQVENLIDSRKRLKSRYREFVGPHTNGHNGVDAPGKGLPAADVAFLAHVHAAIEEHLGNEDFGVEELAVVMGHSRSTIHRRLRGLRQLSPTDFLREVRLERAATLLKDRRGTISEVAYAVGFKSVSHFSQVFRARYGVAPSMFVIDDPRSTEAASAD